MKPLTSWALLERVNQPEPVKVELFLKGRPPIVPIPRPRSRPPLKLWHPSAVHLFGALILEGIIINGLQRGKESREP